MSNTTKSRLKAFGKEFVSFKEFAKASKAGDEFAERISKAGDRTRAFSFYEDEIITIPNGDDLQIDVRDNEFKGIKYAIIWFVVDSNINGRYWAPAYIFRQVPTEKEQEKFFSESKLSDEMMNPSIIKNDIDRIERLLGRSFKVNRAIGYHADRWDKATETMIEGGKDFRGFIFKEISTSSIK